MCSSEMETELGKEVAAFSLCDDVPQAMTGSVRCGSQMPSFSAGVSFPASSSPPQLVPAPLVVSPPRNFSYSDLQLVVTSNPPPAHARVLSNGNLGGDGDVDGDGDGEEEEKKRERDSDLQLQHLHKKRSKNWSRVETLKLIKTRAELDSSVFQFQIIMVTRKTVSQFQIIMATRKTLFQFQTIMVTTKMFQ